MIKCGQIVFVEHSIYGVHFGQRNRPWKK